MKPPEKHAEIITTRLRMPASSSAARSCGGVIHSSSSGGNVTASSWSSMPCMVRYSSSRSSSRSIASRSEEHTSELQSLMRISYAVFCLKKKTSQLNHLLKHTHYNNHA